VEGEGGERSGDRVIARDLVIWKIKIYHEGTETLRKAAEGLPLINTDNTDQERSGEPEAQEFHRGDAEARRDKTKTFETQRKGGSGGNWTEEERQPYCGGTRIKERNLYYSALPWPGALSSPRHSAKRLRTVEA